MRAMIVREISTVALLTEAVMRLEQSCGLFCRSLRGLGAFVTMASWGLIVLGVLDFEPGDEAGWATL